MMGYSYSCQKFSYPGVTASLMMLYGNSAATHSSYIQVLLRDNLCHRNFVNPPFIKFLLAEKEDTTLKSLKDYSIVVVNRILAGNDCPFREVVEKIQALDIPSSLQDELKASGLYGADVQRLLNDGLKRHLEQPCPFFRLAQQWLLAGAKITPDIQLLLNSNYIRAIEQDDPFSAKEWAVLGAKIPEHQKVEMQQQLNVRMKECTYESASTALCWYELGAQVDEHFQLDLDDWLAMAFEYQSADSVSSCLKMGGTIDNLQGCLDGAMSRALATFPAPELAIGWKRMGAEVKAEDLAYINTRLEHSARDANPFQFALWLEMGATVSEKVKILLDKAAERLFRQCRYSDVKDLIDLGAMKPFHQTCIDRLCARQVTSFDPFGALACVKLGARIRNDLQPWLNAGLRAALANNTWGVSYWSELGGKLRFRDHSGMP